MRSIDGDDGLQGRKEDACEEFVVCCGVSVGLVARKKNEGVD